MRNEDGIKCVVVVGNPWYGMRLYGPFASIEAGEAWAQENATDEAWEIPALNNPEE